MMQYHVTLGDVEFEVESDGHGKVQVDGTPLRWEFEWLSPALVRATDGQRVYHVSVRSEGDLVELIHSGRRVEATVSDRRSELIRKFKDAAGGARSGGVVKAPMPGLVLRVLVNVGDEVSHDTGVAVLEAMKMENEIKAGTTGIVRSIGVSEGQAVEKGFALIDVAGEA